MNGQKTKSRITPADHVPVGCLATFLAVWVALAVAPSYRADWLLENLPTFVAVPLAIGTYRRFRFSDRSYIQATAFLLLHTVGSHYTYSEVPLGNWMGDALDLSRNHYDRVVHFMFGLLMLRPTCELVIRRPNALGPYAFAYLSIAATLFWAPCYEIIEWITATLADPAAGTAYLGTQGDVWDAQKDMTVAGVGAALAAVFELRRRSSRNRGNSWNE